MRTFSVSRKASSRRDRSNWTFQATVSIGTTQRKRATPARPMFTKEEPVSVSYGLGIPEHDKEGRVITAEFDDYYVVTCYTPNSQDGLNRLDYRMEWEDAFLSYLKKLEEKKPVVFCGDLNVAHKEIDLKNPKTNRKNAGFTDEEREKFTRLLDAGFIDTWRYFNPDLEGVYSWWSYRFSAAQKNARVAHRLFLRIRQPEGPAGERGHPHGCYGKRSLSGGSGDRGLKERVYES